MSDGSGQGQEGERLRVPRACAGLQDAGAHRARLHRQSDADQVARERRLPRPVRHPGAHQRAQRPAGVQGQEDGGLQHGDRQTPPSDRSAQHGTVRVEPARCDRGRQRRRQWRQQDTSVAARQEPGDQGPRRHSAHQPDDRRVAHSVGAQHGHAGRGEALPLRGGEVRHRVARAAQGQVDAHALASTHRVPARRDPPVRADRRERHQGQQGHRLQVQAAPGRHRAPQQAGARDRRLVAGRHGHRRPPEHARGQGPASLAERVRRVAQCARGARERDEVGRHVAFGGRPDGQAHRRAAECARQRRARHHPGRAGRRVRPDAQAGAREHTGAGEAARLHREGQRRVRQGEGAQRDEQAARGDAAQPGRGQRQLQRALQPLGGGHQVLQRPDAHLAQVPGQAHRLRVRAQDREGRPHEGDTDELVAADAANRLLLLLGHRSAETATSGHHLVVVVVVVVDSTTATTATIWPGAALSDLSESLLCRHAQRLLSILNAGHAATTITTTPIHAAAIQSCLSLSRLSVASSTATQLII